MDENKLNDQENNTVNNESAADAASEEVVADAEVAEAEVVSEEKAEDPMDEAQAIIADAVANFKVAFAELKKQFAPVKESLLEMANAIKDGVAEARADAGNNAADAENSDAADADKTEAADADQADKSDAESDSVEDKIEDKIDQAGEALENNESVKTAVSAAHEASAMLTAGIEKFRKRASNMKFDLKDIISREFENVADKELDESDYVIDENGKRVVKIDGKFMKNHANEVVPAILRGAVSSLFSAFLGADEKADDNADKAADDTAADDAEVAADDKADDEVKESKYRVEFDFSNDIDNAIRSAELSSEDGSGDAHSRNVGREVLIEGARIFEEGLNGKMPQNVDERFENAVKRADGKDEKSDEDIEVIDEKHRKILELSKQFEMNMNSDDDED